METAKALGTWWTWIIVIGGLTLLIGPTAALIVLVVLGIPLWVLSRLGKGDVFHIGGWYLGQEDAVRQSQEVDAESKRLREEARQAKKPIVVRRRGG